MDESEKTDSLKISAAAHALAEHRLHPTQNDPLPSDLRPRDEIQAYAIQRALHQELQSQGLGCLAGYKIGCTTQVMQAFLDIDHPCAGGIMGQRLFTGATVLPFASFARVGVECEIAVRLKRPIRSALSHHALAAAIAEYRPAIEIVDARYENYSALDAATLIADDFFQSACVLGETGIQVLSNHVLTAKMCINGELVGTGTSADILGHPLNALAWLAQHLEIQNQAIVPDTWISLGSMVETQWLSIGDRVDITVSGLGEATFRVV